MTKRERLLAATKNPNADRDMGLFMKQEIKNFLRTAGVRSYKPASKEGFVEGEGAHLYLKKIDPCVPDIAPDWVLEDVKNHFENLPGFNAKLNWDEHGICRVETLPYVPETVEQFLQKIKGATYQRWLNENDDTGPLSDIGVSELGDMTMFRYGYIAGVHVFEKFKDFDDKDQKHSITVEHRKPRHHSDDPTSFNGYGYIVYGQSSCGNCNHLTEHFRENITKRPTYLRPRDFFSICVPDLIAENFFGNWLTYMEQLPEENFDKYLQALTSPPSVKIKEDVYDDMIPF